MKCSNQNLQNILYFMHKKTHVCSFFSFCETLLFPYWMPWSMSACTRAFIWVISKCCMKWKSKTKLWGTSYANIIKDEAFLWNMSLSTNFLFLRSVALSFNEATEWSSLLFSSRHFFLYYLQRGKNTNFHLNKPLLYLKFVFYIIRFFLIQLA